MLDHTLRRAGERGLANVEAEQADASNQLAAEWVAERIARAGGTVEIVVSAVGPGTRWIVGEALSENHAIQDLTRELGFDVHSNVGDGTVEMKLDLSK